MLLVAFKKPNFVKCSNVSFRKFCQHSELPLCRDVQVAFKSISYLFQILNDTIRYFYDTIIFQYLYLVLYQVPVLDPNMNMSAHVSKVIKSANYHLRNFGKIRKFLNIDTTKSAIVSLVTSRLDYCNGLLCGITDELLCRLQEVQNNAARVVSGSKKYDHITPVLKDLHWLLIRKRIEFKILLLTFKCMQGCAPLYLRELLVKQANTRTLRSNTKNLLQIPLTNLKRFGDRAFCAYAPRLWNELPDNIKAADSVQNFKKQLKTLLFRKEFN